MHEPLFQNVLFAGISTSRSFIKYFTNSGINKVRDLMEPSLKRWLPAGSISKKIGLHSMRVVGEHEDSNPDFSTFKYWVEWGK